MKVIVTGATGFVGGGVVRHCIKEPLVLSILVLSRKEIAPELSGDAKVEVILHQDFSSYPSDLIDRLKGAEGCIWCIGGKAGDFSDVLTARKISVDYTIAAAEAFANTLATQLPPGQKFPFVFCSGWGAEWNQDAKLWFLSDTRKIKGAVEKGLFDVAKTHSSRFKTTVLRPGGILPDEKTQVYKFASMAVQAVLVSSLAKVMVDVCVGKSIADMPAPHIIENADIVKLSVVSRIEPRKANYT